MNSSKTQIFEEVDTENANTHLKPAIYEPTGKMDIEPPNFDKIPKLIQDSGLNTNVLGRDMGSSYFDSKMLSKRSLPISEHGNERNMPLKFHLQQVYPEL